MRNPTHSPIIVRAFAVVAAAGIITAVVAGTAAATTAPSTTTVHVATAANGNPTPADNFINF